MSLIAKDKGGSDFEPITAGMHHAICYGVVDLGTQPAFGQIPARAKVVFIWELPEERGEFTRERDGKTEKVNMPRAISLTLTNSLSKKSNMRPMLESWRGRPFTEAELEGFDLRNVCGANCYLNIIHETKGDKTYANVKSVNPLPKGAQKKVAENPPLKFAIDDFKGEITFPDNMPDWIKGRVMQSDEYILKAQKKGQPDQGADGHTAENLDEDVPF